MESHQSRFHKKAEKLVKSRSKKERIIALFLMGIHQLDEIANIVMARPSYVASVLQQAGLVSGYFDLYTSTSSSMNVYSQYFKGQLGFKDEEIARKSVELIDHLYKQFESKGDRAGQHHALNMALIMFNRARWTNKESEADIFRAWLVSKLTKVLPNDSDFHLT